MISSTELARICGVSQGTVDRALHDRPGISGKTKQKILAAAAKHGYRPHPAARELLTGERRLIGAIVPGVDSVFFMNLVEQIRIALGGDGYRMFVTPVSDDEEFFEALEDLAARRARAIVAVPPRDNIVVPQHILNVTSVISLTNTMKGKGVISMMPDEVQAGRDAADYLAGKGHTSLLHLTYERDVSAMRARARGFTDRVRELGLKTKTIRPPDTARLLDEVERRSVTAIFCHNDWLALNAIRALEASGRRVPGDVSVMGVDDTPTFVALYPDMTTMHYPYEDIARATKQLMAGRKPDAVGRIEVVERKTVAGVA